MDYLLNENKIVKYATYAVSVLNLIINGLPSKLQRWLADNYPEKERFKPYYKWITF